MNGSSKRRHDRSHISKPFNTVKDIEGDLIYSSGQILSSMNSEPDHLARDVFINNLQSNLGDPALFPNTSEIEKRVIRILGDLVQLPSSGTGLILSGGSEANITALWAIRNKRMSDFKFNGYITPEIIAPESVHVSIDKAVNLLGLKLIKVPTTSQYQIDLNTVKETVNDKTIAIIGVAGTTALGTIDPLIELNRICLENTLDFHIDAAFGGLVFPFLKSSKEKFNLSFELEALISMTIDIHKMGRVPIPGGGLLWRDRRYPKTIQFTLPYLSGKPTQTTISGTRSGASAIAFMALWDHLGYEGFKEIVNTCIINTKFLSKEMEKRGFLIPIRPVINIVGVKTPEDFPIDVVTLQRDLWIHGWTTTIVNGFLRLVVMPPTKKQKLEEFLDLLDELINN
ncbi:MAG: tyrosine decarboxylase MfnA [Candidatus Hodarchaeota archaeon]